LLDADPPAAYLVTNGLILLFDGFVHPCSETGNRQITAHNSFLVLCRLVIAIARLSCANFCKLLKESAAYE